MRIAAAELAQLVLCGQGHRLFVLPVTVLTVMTLDNADPFDLGDIPFHDHAKGRLSKRM